MVSKESLPQTAGTRSLIDVASRLPSTSISKVFPPFRFGLPGLEMTRSSPFVIDGVGRKCLTSTVFFPLAAWKGLRATGWLARGGIDGRKFAFHALEPVPPSYRG